MIGIFSTLSHTSDFVAGFDFDNVLFSDNTTRNGTTFGFEIPTLARKCV